MFTNRFSLSRIESDIEISIYWESAQALIL